MEDTGGKSGRRPERHLQAEASGPGNARPAHWRLAGRFRRGEVVEGCAGGAEGRSKTLICLRGTWMEDTGGTSGRRPGRHLQVAASGLAMPRLHTGGLLADSGAAPRRKGARAGQRVDRRGSYASVGPGWKIQEASRVGAQGVTSKSKLLAREMPRVCSGGLRVDSGEDCRWKGGCAGPGSKVDTPEASSGPA